MRKIFLFSAAALMLFACSKEDTAPQAELQNDDAPRHIFYASTEGATPGTKVYADEDLKVLWNENDSISIFFNRTYNDLYVFDGEDGDNGGGFEEYPPSNFFTYNPLDHIFAVYPYSKANKINNQGSRITVNLPAQQTFKEHSFGIGANTMVAVTDDNFLGFKNVCGYLKFRFWGDDVKVKSVKLEGNNGEKIAGKAYITPVVDGTPTVEMADEATGSITINCAAPVQLGTSSSDYTEFIFVIPPTVFSGGFKVTVTDEMGGVFEKSSTRSLEIKRNKMESMGTMKVTPNYDDIFVHFDDEAFYQMCIRYFDSNSDGKISYAEAFAVTNMHFDGTEAYEWGCINSCGGLERFKNLKVLYLDNNRIVNLDVSQNTKLEQLYVSHNYNNVTQAATLTFGDNSSLRVLECADWELESLVVWDQLPALEELDCSYNPLTELWVNSPSLKKLNCSSTNITSLSVTNMQLNTLNADYCGYLERLYCHTNQLTSLSLRSCTSLYALYCGYNLMTSLNVSTNTGLEVLDCRDNQISSLDLSNNSALDLLKCDGNRLTELDVRNNATNMTLQAWPQTGTLGTLKKMSAQQITYKDSNSNVINPADYGTTIQHF